MLNILFQTSNKITLTTLRNMLKFVFKTKQMKWETPNILFQTFNNRTLRKILDFGFKTKTNEIRKPNILFQTSNNITLTMWRKLLDLGFKTKTYEMTNTNSIRIDARKISLVIKPRIFFKEKKSLTRTHKFAERTEPNIRNS